MLLVATIGEMELRTVLDPNTIVATISHNVKSCGTESYGDSEEESNVKGEEEDQFAS
jgi:hypothetical protein